MLLTPPSHVRCTQCPPPDEVVPLWSQVGILGGNRGKIRGLVGIQTSLQGPSALLFVQAQRADALPLTSSVSDLDELETRLAQGDAQVGAGLSL